jgi:hypothetical protein
MAIKIPSTKQIIKIQIPCNIITMNHIRTLNGILPALIGRFKLEQIHYVPALPYFYNVWCYKE